MSERKVDSELLNDVMNYIADSVAKISQDEYLFLLIALHKEHKLRISELTGDKPAPSIECRVAQMKLTEYLTSGRIINKKAKLKIDIHLENGESMKKGETGSLLIDFGNGKYHFEHNGFACQVSREEIEFINV